MTRAGLLATAFLAWSGLAVGSDAAELKKVNFAFNYTVNEAHIAYWVALEKGYYRDKGLDVETQYSKGSGDAVAKVDIGRADIALADAMTMRIWTITASVTALPLGLWSNRTATVATLLVLISVWTGSNT